MWQDNNLKLSQPKNFLNESSREELCRVRDFALKKFMKKYDIGQEDLQNAKQQIINDLKGNTGPKYCDPKIVSAYIQYYHLQHMGMAYQVFFKVLSSIISLKIDQLYMCDVGAGTGAACFGLELALREATHSIQIILDIIEPSDPMYKASKCIFKEYKRNSKPLKFKFPNRVKFEDHNSIRITAESCSIKIVTAFHLALPYQSALLKCNQCAQTLKSVLNVIKPDICLFTVNENKKESIQSIVQEYLNKPLFKTGTCGVPKVDNSNFKTPTRSVFVWGIANHLLKSS